ncbi:MAG: hypothetical protein ACK41C_14505 [Phenylobacterium sp.]|uniref:hypothetical protein n=1 Tax=Phenylobacterium sp. TaxID=1871053 RepID=UPI00391B606E
MSLVRGREPGLWVNDAWSPGLPGLFAVVIGVSFYDHLPGGVPGKAARNGTTVGGQLVCSALTGAALFHWLKERCDIDGCPIAEVRLLLSPTAEEQADPRWKLAPGDYEAPVFTACERAIRRWAKVMGDQPAEARRASRGLFLFSGHGLNNLEKPILLPSDYLDPDVGEPADDAISVEGLRAIARQTGTGEVYLMLDACQNPATLLGGVAPEGRAPLPTRNATAAGQPNFAAKFMASLAGRQAFQWNQLRYDPAAPRVGLSFFGQALMEALDEDLVDLFPPGDTHVVVKPRPLDSYLTRRVEELVHAAGGSPGLFARMEPLGGNLDAAEVAIVAARRVAPAPPGLNVQAEPAAFSVAAAPMAGADQAREAGLPKTELDAAIVEAAKMREDQFTDLGPPPPPVGLATPADLHGFFRHEYATELWSKGRVMLRGANSARPVAPSDIEFLGGAVSDNGRVYRIDVRLHARLARGAWLEIGYPGAGGAGLDAFGMILPNDMGTPAPVRLAVRFSEDLAQVEHLAGRLAPYSDAGDEAARLYRLAEIDRERLAGQVAAEAGALERMLAAKAERPIAAMTAAALLLEADRLAPLDDYALRLAEQFDDLSDGAVLWADQLRRLYEPQDEAGLDKAERAARRALRGRIGPAAAARRLQARALAEIPLRGTPVLQPLVLVAQRLLAGAEDLAAEVGQAEPEIAVALLHARRLIDGATASLWFKQPWVGGLMAVYYGLPFGGDFRQVIGRGQSRQGRGGLGP